MTSPLSLLGAMHAAISLVPVAAGLYGFVRHGALDPCAAVQLRMIRTRRAGRP